ncbi:DNA-binding domain-containing protein, partial [Mannheimia haemolytica]
QADSGWTPANTFTLLRIKPEVAWENINDRPNYFAGKVKVVTETDEKVPESDSPQQLPEIVDSHIPDMPMQIEEVLEAPAVSKKEAKGQTISTAKMAKEISTETVDDLTDFVLNMFAPKTSIEQSAAEIEALVEAPLQKFEQNSPLVEDMLPNPSKKSIENPRSSKADNSMISMQSVPVQAVSGKEFVNWLKKGVAVNKFAINKPSAKLHIVEDHLFLVTPVIFEMYLQETGQPYDKETINNIQYDFQGLGIHSPKNMIINGKPDTINFWKCDVIGPRKTSSLTGYLIKNTRLFFGDKVLLNNHCLTLQKEET